MLADPFVSPVVVTAGGAVTRSWPLVSMTGNASIRVNPTHTAGAPSTLKLTHQTAGSGAMKRDRHLARQESLQVTGGVEDSTKPPVVFYVVGDIPQSADAALVSAAWKEFVGMLLGSSGNTAYPMVEATFFTPWKSGQS